MPRFLIILFQTILLSLFSPHSLADQLAPDFHLRNLQSNTEHALSDYRGKVVYLDFWASWCGPCRQSLPALDELQREVGSEQFEVVAINLDANRDDALAFLQQYPVSYTVLTDKTGRTSRSYDLVGLPSSVLVDKNGIIVSSFQGFHPSHIDKLRKALPYLME